MNVAIFGGFEKRPLAPGWRKETLVAILGGGDADLADAPPGPDAQLTAIAILGGIKLVVPPASSAAVSWTSFRETDRDSTSRRSPCSGVSRSGKGA
jgi:hypothetical protein